VPKPLDVKPLTGYRIWIRYDDGVDGEVDLSDLVGRGVFAAWADVPFFETVHLAPHRAVAWSPDIELCPDALYLRLTGKTPEDLFPSLKSVSADA
jgi:hypothetical protein